MRNEERILSVSDLPVLTKMLQSHQKPTKSHMQKRYSKRTRSAKVYQTIKRKQYQCLLTAVDYRFAFSVRYIGRILGIRKYVINRLKTNPETGIVFMNARTHECINVYLYEYGITFKCTYI